MIGPEWNSIPVEADPLGSSLLLMLHAVASLAAGIPASTWFDRMKQFFPWPQNPQEYLQSPKWRKWAWYWFRGIETYGETFYIRKFAPKFAQAVFSILLGTLANALIAVVSYGEFSVYIMLSGGLTYLASQFKYDYEEQSKAKLAAPEPKEEHPDV